MNPFSRSLCQQVNLPSLPARFNPANAKCHCGAHLHQLPAWSFAITKPSQQCGSGQTDVGQCHGALISPSWPRSYASTFTSILLNSFCAIVQFTSVHRLLARMTKLIVVCGATGGLGGSVARCMLKEGWKVRGITRNSTSAPAKALIDAGDELAAADYNDVASLEKAFQVGSRTQTSFKDAFLMQNARVQMLSSASQTSSSI